VEQKQLDKFRVWFDDYVAGFYGDDEVINANLKLKEKHSRRTCREKLLDFLPGTEDIERVKEKIFGYVDSRLKRETIFTLSEWGQGHVPRQ